MTDLEIIETGSQLATLQKTHITKPMSLKKIHSFLFQGLRPWAGQYRTTGSWKNGTSFCPAEHIPKNITKCTNTINRAINQLSETNNFDQLAYGFNQLNHTHPFTDGNGRVQREWLRQILYAHGYILNLNTTTGDDLIKASYLACHGKRNMLQNILQSCIVKDNNPLAYYQNLDYLAILSHDDNDILSNTISLYKEKQHNKYSRLPQSLR